MRNSLKKIALGVVALSAFALTACMSSGSNVGPEANDKNATVFITAKMKNVNTLSKPGLGKLTPIALTTLRITAVSDKAAPRVFGEDSIVVSYSVGADIGGTTFTGNATADQNFSTELSLRPLRSWTIRVETVDDEGDVIQSGTASLGQLFAGQIKGLSVTAGALYNNYAATFNFADSITSTTGTIQRQDLKVTSFSMTIDSDSAFNTAVIPANGVKVDTNYVLNIFKVDTALGSSDQDSVRLKVYGFLPQGPDNGGTALAPILLYSGAKALNELSLASATTVTLTWVGPKTGVADLSITVSKVGTIEIIAETDPEVID